MSSVAWCWSVFLYLSVWGKSSFLCGGGCHGSFAELDLGEPTKFDERLEIAGDLQHSVNSRDGRRVGGISLDLDEHGARIYLLAVLVPLEALELQDRDGGASGMRVYGAFARKLKHLLVSQGAKECQSVRNAGMRELRFRHGTDCYGNAVGASLVHVGGANIVDTCNLREVAPYPKL
mmetsp:Transcript_17924/g.50510  ORF Transcript_17924/g.50510 Transcript_17924/m.50510 type:complete len:177 (+) Transcript_17924:77-607(+)